MPAHFKSLSTLSDILQTDTELSLKYLSFFVLPIITPMPELSINSVCFMSNTTFSDTTALYKCIKLCDYQPGAVVIHLLWHKVCHPVCFLDIIFYHVTLFLSCSYKKDTGDYLVSFVILYLIIASQQLFYCCSCAR